jgi:hypothetical protein
MDGSPMLTEAALRPVAAVINRTRAEGGPVDQDDMDEARESGAAFLAAQDRDALTEALWDALDDRGVDVGHVSCRAGIDALLGAGDMTGTP